MNLIVLALVLLGVPLLAAACCLVLRHKQARNLVIVAVAAIMAAAAVGAAVQLVQAGQPLLVVDQGWAERLELPILIVDLGVLGLVARYALRLRDRRILVLSAAQLLAALYLHFVLGSEPTGTLVYLDSLSAILLLISSILGPVVTIFAIGYMNEHEAHATPAHSRLPRFFALLFLFLATMNAFAMVDNLLWMYTLWEITTLCSFLLIAHDETDLAWKNAGTALWMNSLGGLAFIVGAAVLTHAWAQFR